MKLYIKNSNNKKVNTLCIEKYKHKTNKCIYILSENGIIKNINNKLVMTNIIDIPVYEINIGNNTFICDNSKFISGDEVYQIPVNHYVEYLEWHYYVLRPKSNIQFVVEYKNNNINDFYFQTNENVNVDYVQEDIITFCDIINII